MEKFNLNPHHTRHPGKHSATLGNFREDRHSYIVIPDDDVRRRSGIQGLKATKFIKLSFYPKAYSLYLKISTE